MKSEERRDARATARVAPTGDGSAAGDRKGHPYGETGERRAADSRPYGGKGETARCVTAARPGRLPHVMARRAKPDVAIRVSFAKAGGREDERVRIATPALRRWFAMTGRGGSLRIHKIYIFYTLH